MLKIQFPIPEKGEGLMIYHRNETGLLKCGIHRSCVLKFYLHNWGIVQFGLLNSQGINQFGTPANVYYTKAGVKQI